LIDEGKSLAFELLSTKKKAIYGEILFSLVKKQRFRKQVNWSPHTTSINIITFHSSTSTTTNWNSKWHTIKKDM
jgi:hypothetical protein